MAILKMTKEQYQKLYGEKPNSFSNTPVQNQPKTWDQKLGAVGQGIGNVLGGNKIGEYLGGQIAKGKFGKTIQKAVSGYNLTPEQEASVSLPTGKQVAGDFLKAGTTIGSAALPGAGSFIGKVAQGAGVGYALDVGNKLTQNKSIPQSLTPGLGTALGAGIPVVGAGMSVTKNIASRLLKGVGSKLSGVSSETIDKIIQNPKTAQRATQILEKNGNNKLLETNAKTIINGVGQIKKEARAAYGKALDELKDVDIDPGAFKAEVRQVLDKYGSVKNGTRVLKNVEFDSPKLHQKASDLIDRVSKANFDLNGKSLRKLADDIENSKFTTTATDAERLSFNAFLNDLSSRLTNAIHMSTDKFGPMNAKFTKDMQLAETVEDIFGKVNFKNLPEVVKASQKLEQVFNQKGLAPQVVDDFLNRIGVNPAEFKTSEAVRQIANKQMSNNPVGLTFGELTQAITSSAFTPNFVKSVATKTGLTKNALMPFLNSLKQMSPTARSVILNSLLSGQASSQNPDASGLDLR